MKKKYAYFKEKTTVYAHVPSSFGYRANTESYKYSECAESIIDNKMFLMTKNVYLKKRPPQENFHRFFIQTEAEFFECMPQLKILVSNNEILDEFYGFTKNIEIIAPTMLVFRINELLNENNIYRDEVRETYEGYRVIRYHVPIGDGATEFLNDYFDVQE